MKKSFTLNACCIFFFLLLLSFNSQGQQPWMKNVKNKENPNFHDVKQAFDTYWKAKVPPGGQIPKGKGYKQFKRWEWFWEPRVGPDGEFPNPSVAMQEWEKYRAAHPEAKQSSNIGKKSSSTGQEGDGGLSISVSSASVTGGVGSAGAFLLHRGV